MTIVDIVTGSNLVLVFAFLTDNFFDRFFLLDKDFKLFFIKLTFLVDFYLKPLLRPDKSFLFFYKETTKSVLSSKKIRRIDKYYFIL